MIPDSFAVDANVLIGALLGGGAARVLRGAPLGFLTTERTIWEVRKYLPRIAEIRPQSETALLSALECLPVVTVLDERYLLAMPTALSLIGWRDPDDAELLALALTLHLPIWSNDRDFQGIAGVEVLTTDDMVRRYLDQPS